MSYGNHLSRIRAQNYATGILAAKGHTITIDTCSSCHPPNPNPPNPPDIPIPILTKGIQMLGQSRIANRRIHVGTTFEDSDASSLCCIPFVPAYVTPHQKRLIRVTCSLLLIDTSADRVGRLFLSLFLDGHNVYNLCDEYCTTSENQFSKSVRFDTFLDVPVSENQTQLELCVTASSDTCYCSANRGPYSGAFGAGLSYVSVEDIAGI